MPNLSKQKRTEWSFFIRPITKRRTYNELCRSCVNKCKQSFRAIEVACPRYVSKRAVYYEKKLKEKDK